jgi:OOP family OmpA-OmpF porin
MKRLMTSMLGGGLLLATAGFAAAADMVEAPMETTPSGIYIAGRIGTAFAQDTRFGVLGTTVTNNYDSVGFNGSLAVGNTYEFGGFQARAELEGGYMTNGIDSHLVAGVGNFTGAAAFGRTNVLYGLVNGYVDFGSGPFKPYIGAGIGAANVDFDNHGVNAVGTAMNDSAAGLAWQVGAGASYALTQQTTLELGYRYFNVENVSLTAVDNTRTDVDVRAHQINFGVRYAF